MSVVIDSDHDWYVIQIRTYLNNRKGEVVASGSHILYIWLVLHKALKRKCTFSCLRKIAPHFWFRTISCINRHLDLHILLLIKIDVHWSILTHNNPYMFEGTITKTIKIYEGEPNIKLSLYKYNIMIYIIWTL